MTSRARFQNNRIRAMLEKCTGESPNDHKNEPPEETQSQQRFFQYSEVRNTMPLGNSMKIPKNASEKELVDALYAEPFSMNLSIFRTFDERKTSYNYGLNFSEINATLNADSLLNNLQMNDEELSLICNEIMLPPSCPLIASDANQDALPPTPLIHSPAQDFSSDDSVKDKNYSPSQSSSDDDDPPPLGRSRLTKLLAANPEDVLIELDHAIHTRTPPEAVPLNEDVSPIITVTADSTTRKKISLLEKKNKQKQAKILTYNVKIGCDEKCLKKCSSMITSEVRKDINKTYWALSWQERRLFIQKSTAVSVPKRKTTSEPKRAPRNTFILKNDDGINVEVCKVFFLTTLGFNKNNDTVLYNSLKIHTVDKRGLHSKSQKFDRKLLTDHVESFHPLEPHYRREHAPLRRYLACDLNVAMMHKDFCERYPARKVSYELYRTHLKTMNVSFAKLGNEECEVCETYALHAKITSHDAKNTVPEDCETCVSYACHREKYKEARELYKLHKLNPQSSEHIYFSADLQKVIMLPRLDGFKSIIFCPRLTTYNMSFAPVGKVTNEHAPIACLWHDGTSGRKQEDILSCYYHFIVRYRNVKHITLWMDNCSAQNKNWLLFSLMIFLINSDLIATETITFQYFEKGHTFMSCDQFHHQIEHAMKKKSKLYDFQDLHDCVASANKSRTDVKVMEPKDFFKFQSFVSDRRIQMSEPRVYLKDLIQVQFQRQSHDIKYKCNINDENFKNLRFMTDKYLKNPAVLKPEFKKVPKGIEKTRKSQIVKVLNDICPIHKMRFWHEMKESS